MARSTMAALIARVRLLINDPASVSQQFSDDDIQAIMDESREDVFNQSLITKPTFTGSTIQYLDYYSSLGGWEDGYVLKQYLTRTVTPSTVEPIVGHFQFAATTLPPVFITGNLHDVYRAAADLLERWAVRWALSYDVNVDGQALRRGQVITMLQTQANKYRLQQRATTISAGRGDLNTGMQEIALGAREIDYMASGNGSGN